MNVNLNLYFDEIVSAKDKLTIYLTNGIKVRFITIPFSFFFFHLDMILNLRNKFRFKYAPMVL